MFHCPAGKGLKFTPAGIDGGFLAWTDPLAADTSSDLVKSRQIALDVLTKSFGKAVPCEHGQWLRGRFVQALTRRLRDLITAGVPNPRNSAARGIVGG